MDVEDMLGIATLAPSAQKRRINELMREGLRAKDPDEPIPFFCECDADACYRAVWRTGRQYDEACRSGTWQALAHRPEIESATPALIEP